MRISGGGNSLRLRNEDLENFEKITTQSKVEDVVKNTSPLAGEVEFVNTNSGEGSIKTLTTMRSSRRFAPQDDMCEIESNKNTSLALGERVSAGQERGQLQDLTEITLTRKSSFRETLKQIFNPLPKVEGN